MYFLEQYMKELKEWVRQRARPEGSMAEGYIVAEGMHLVSDYAQRLYKDIPWLWKNEDASKVAGLLLPKVISTETMKPYFRDQVHRFLLLNSPCMKKWRELHERE